MQEFDLLIPQHMDEALEAIARTGVTARPLAGGTDMIVDLRAKRARADVLVSLQNLDELRGVTRTNGTLKIGSATRIAEFLKQPELVAHDALRQAAFWFANPMIRNTATVGGNIASASPAGDMLPPLLALDAQIELMSRNATRTMPLADFFLGPRKTARGSDELISGVHVPVMPDKSDIGSAFYKLGLRQADAISLVSVAVLIARDGEKIRDVRIALGAVAPRPMRATRAEGILRGQTFHESIVQEAGRAAMAECSPIDDLRGTAAYRRRMVAVYVRRMLEQAWNKTK